MLIERSARVPYTAERMYALVNDVPSYQEFLPWCESSGILESREGCYRAYLRLGSKLLRLCFVTENYLDPGRSVQLRLVRGPFRRLEGVWSFEPLGEAECRVGCRLDFEFRGRWAHRVLAPVFGRLADSMLDSFVERAGALYG